VARLVRVIYADPPYLGRCRYYGHRHERWGCFDELDTHRALLDYLGTFDGWACSCSSTSLADLLPLVPGARVGAWVKPWTPYRPGQRVNYAWEAVLFVSARADGIGGRDFVVEQATRRGHRRHGLIGAKPDRVCRWIADLLGYVDGDELVDLFPGSGSMSAALAQGRLVGLS
jgi:hypothetical protein